MSEEKTYPVSEAAASQSHLSVSQYNEMYQKSINDAETFWAEQANEFLTVFETWDQVSSSDFTTATATWFRGAKLNASYNCIDRHLEKRGDQTAIIWEGDEPDQDLKISYRDLHEAVCRLSNALKARGVGKGDRVCIYMPMIPEAAYAMLACARIGAIHSVVFGGFSPESIKDRILDSDCQTVITADEGVRGGKIIPLKANVDTALDECPNVHSVFVVRRTGAEISWTEGRDVDYRQAVSLASAECAPEIMDAEDPLFILYTSGSTGKPKGVMHTTAGYLLGAAMTHKYVFDYHKRHLLVYCGRRLGHGPLLHCLRTAGKWCHDSDVRRSANLSGQFPVLASRGQASGQYFLHRTDSHQSINGCGQPTGQQHFRTSLRILGSVGEPINPEAWEWYYSVVGESRCPIVDTWWQTETGAIMITPLPGVTDLKPGSATKPFFGVKLALLDADGNELDGPAEGNLVISQSWPSQIRSVFGDHERCINTYFSAIRAFI